MAVLFSELEKQINYSSNRNERVLGRSSCFDPSLYGNVKLRSASFDSKAIRHVFYVKRFCFASIRFVLTISNSKNRSHTRDSICLNKVN